MRTVGEAGTAIRLLAAEPRPDGQILRVAVAGVRHEMLLPLPGRFQADNALIAAALASALGQRDALDHLGSLRGVRGRLELAARLPNGAAIYVDYAHTPDALERVLTTARRLVPSGGRLAAVFGCGGDRDRGKRPIMGEIAARIADRVWVTSDNPRTESPEAIVAEVMVGVARAGAGAGAHVAMPDRQAAIHDALGWARGGDVVVIAGKGHETYQIVGSSVLPFDDRAVARAFLERTP